MDFLKNYLLLILATYSKQDCEFFSNSFSCKTKDIQNIAYEFNSKKPKDTEILSIQILESDYTDIDNFFQFLNSSSREKIIEIRITNCKVKQVSEKAFEQYTTLKVLDLSNNGIEDIVFVKYLPASITDLYLMNNGFTHIDDVFTNMKNLQVIDLSFCKLNNVDFTVFKEITSIEVVNVSNNNIESSISKEFLKNIKCVDISHNSLTRDDNIPSFCLDFSYTNISGYRWYNVSERNSTVVVDKFYYVGNKNLHINATNVHGTFLDIEIGYLNISEYKANISDIDLKKVKITKELILKGSTIPLLHKSIYDFKDLFFNENPDTIFDLSNNSVTEITEFYFEKYNLGILNLCYNKINVLRPNVFHEAHFGELLLCHCGIKNIDGATFTGIIVEKLNLSHNSIDKVNFLGNINRLQKLDLSYNVIEFINVNIFSNLYELEIINLSNNFISSLEAGSFNSDKLVEINLRNNNLMVIKSLSFYNLPNLNYLFLEGNPVKTIESNAFKSLPKLIVLNLANMSLENLQPASFTDLVGLQFLYLNNSNISVLPITLFDNVPSLRYLYLHNNNIISLKALNELNLHTLEISVCDKFQSGSFNIPQLKILYVTDSNIEALYNSYFLDMHDLREFHLKNSIIISLEPDAFRGLFQLEYLDPQVFNKVTILKKYLFNDLLSLRELDLSGLNLTVIEPEAFYGLMKLQILYLNNNHITELKGNVFVGLANVGELDLSRNNISSLYVRTFVGLDGMRKLLLNENNIYSIPLGTLQNLRTLEVLNLTQNKIMQLNIGTFSALKNLKSLDLSFNRISSICQGVLFPLKNLEILYLTGNTLQNISELTAIENLPKLRLIDLNHNNFNCHDLVIILNNFETKNFTVYFQQNQNYERENVDGIVCGDTCSKSLV